MNEKEQNAGTLDPARGIIIGLLVVAPFWLYVICGILYILYKNWGQG